MALRSCLCDFIVYGVVAMTSDGWPCSFSTAATDFDDKIVLAGSGRSREEAKEASTWTKGGHQGAFKAIIGGCSGAAG